MYSMGDRSKNVKQTIVHIEGDPDHPVSRGTLCAKGASLIDLEKDPELVRAEFQQVLTAAGRRLASELLYP